MEFLRSFLRRRLAGKPVVVSPNVGCFLKLSFKGMVKRGQQKHATCFAALLQNELKSDVARFTTHVQTCLATNKGFWKLHQYWPLIQIVKNYAGVTPYTGVTSLAAKQVCLWPVKRATCTGFVAKSRTWFVARQVWKWAVKREPSFCSNVATMLQNKLHIFVARFTVP